MGTTDTVVPQNRREIRAHFHIHDRFQGQKIVQLSLYLLRILGDAAAQGGHCIVIADICAEFSVAEPEGIEMLLFRVPPFAAENILQALRLPAKLRCFLC